MRDKNHNMPERKPELPSLARNLTAPVSFSTYENVLKQHHKSLWLLFLCLMLSAEPAACW